MHANLQAPYIRASATIFDFSYFFPLDFCVCWGCFSFGYIVLMPLPRKAGFPTVSVAITSKRGVTILKKSCYLKDLKFQTIRNLKDFKSLDNFKSFYEYFGDLEFLFGDFNYFNIFLQNQVLLFWTVVNNNISYIFL